MLESGTGWVSFTSASSLLEKPNFPSVPCLFSVNFL